MPLKIRYNSPVVLTFALLCMGIYFSNWILFGDIQANKTSMIRSFFMVGGQFDWGNPLDYVRLFSYTMGHASQGHIAGNMSIFLLIAPIMEEKYGSKNILLMMLSTALITAVFQLLLFDTALLGASGIVFMFIVLVSFADARKGSIPLTFILVVLFFIGKEVIQSMESNQVSEYAHIAGGIMGGIFGSAFREDEKAIDSKSTTTVTDDILDNL